MNTSLLVRLFGFRGALVHSDTLVLDRWKWLKKRIPVTANGESLLDVGCGTGAFTIGAAKRGYKATGVSWNERNQSVAAQRAAYSRAKNTQFVVGDVRNLDDLNALSEHYDVVICFECVEHIINDDKLIKDISQRILPGGRLLLTTPNYLYCPIDHNDSGPFHDTETGWHVRKGYTPDMLNELCQRAGLRLSRTTYCSGYLSQKVTGLWRLSEKYMRSRVIAWAVTLPLRLIPLLLLDGLLTRFIDWPFYSICIEAYKPRYENVEFCDSPEEPGSMME